jgi:hypothetical protein
MLPEKLLSLLKRTPNQAKRKPVAKVKRNKAEPRKPFEIGGVSIPAGTRQTIDLPISLLYDHTPMTLTAHVIHGRRPGPRLFVCAAVHGDELNGVEIIRRLIRSSRISHLHGTLVAVPIVNIYGFIANTRYLPDRRDLNRSFPGSAQGSLASQLAYVFMQEIVGCCDYGIDLHTGAIHRTNFPQVRAYLSNPDIKRLAKAFSAPIILHAAYRDGSLRKSAIELGVPTLVYEAGEALRLDEIAIQTGVNGIIRVMQILGIFGTKVLRPSRISPIFASSSYWVRAPEGGLLRTILTSGTSIESGQILGIIADPYGKSEVEIIAQDAGVLIGKTNLPVVNQGDALFHIAKVMNVDIAEQTVEQFHDEFDSSNEDNGLLEVEFESARLD